MLWLDPRNTIRRGVRAILPALVVGAIWTVVPGAAQTPAGQGAPGARPDWSGVWAMQGGNLFDRAKFAADGKTIGRWE